MGMGCGLSHLIGLNPTGTGSPAKNKKQKQKGEMKNKDTKIPGGCRLEKSSRHTGMV
jgi:hypothetical protein